MRVQSVARCNILLLLFNAARRETNAKESGKKRGTTRKRGEGVVVHGAHIMTEKYFAAVMDVPTTGLPGRG